MRRRSHVSTFASPDEAVQWIETRLDEAPTNSVRFVGLDAEWEGGKQARPVAVLQLSTGAHTAVISLGTSTVLPQTFVRLLEEERFVKCGVGIDQDVSRLLRQYSHLARVAPTRDLSAHLHVLQGTSARRQTYGLARMCSDLLCVSLPKPTTVIRSRWQQVPLEPAQVEYAAADAFFSQALACVMDSRSCELKTPVSSDIHRSTPRQPRGTGRVRTIPIRRRPIFQNIRLEDSDGRLLAFISEERAQHYARTKRGTFSGVIDEESATLRLNYVSHVTDEMLELNPAQKRLNQCVVCGMSEADQLQRSSIVPRVYHRFMAQEWKQFQQSDCMPLCTMCSSVYNRLSGEHTASLAREAGYVERDESDHQCEVARVRALRASKHLQGMDNASSRVFSPDAVAKLRDQIAAYFVESLQTPVPATYLEVQQMCERNDSRNQQRRSMYGTIAEHHQSHDRMKQFVHGWRMLFVTGLRPRFMPDNWKADHFTVRLNNSAAVADSLDTRL